MSNTPQILSLTSIGKTLPPMGLDARYKDTTHQTSILCILPYSNIMSTTPIVSTIPTRPPSSYILENLTIPSQDNGIPTELSLLTPYSRIPSSSPVPVLALATADIEKLETPPPELESGTITTILAEVVAYKGALENAPEGQIAPEDAAIIANLMIHPQMFLPTRDEELAPPVDTHLLPPNPRLALLDDDKPIDYNCVAPTTGDDVDPNDP